jgi:hypothetical protein
MKTEMVFFEAVPPHPAAVSPAELFAQIETVIKKHVVLSDPVTAALAVNDLPHHAAPTGEWRLDKEKSQIHWQNHRFKGCDVAPNGANIN